MKIAVLGSGAGGMTTAYDWTKAGHQVSLFDFKEYSSNIEAINKNGGINADGLFNGLLPLEYAGDDIAKVMKDAEIVFLVGPAYSIVPFANVCKPYLEKGQYVILSPSSCAGAFEFKKEARLTIDDEDIIVAETSTLPYGVRVPEPGKINLLIKLSSGNFMSALPAKYTADVAEKLKDVYKFDIAKNVFQTSLQNGNAVIHPTITILNAARVEAGGGKYLFYKEGVTPAVGRLIEAVDKERIAIGEKLGVEILSDPVISIMQGYMINENYSTGYSDSPVFDVIKAQPSLKHRYLDEDCGYGLVFIASLGKQIGVETKAIDATITIASILNQTDYVAENKRTMKSLGLDKLNLDQLINAIS